MPDPLCCCHTTLQAIDYEAQWPEHLAPITNNLRLAFPASVGQINAAALSKDGFALYRELMDACTAAACCEIGSSSLTVTEVIDTILTSVAQLRILARCPGTDNAKESTAIGLLHILGLVCSPNAVGMAGAPFLLPRSLHPNILERLDCEGYASLLVGISLYKPTSITGLGNRAVSETGHGKSGYGQSTYRGKVSAEHSTSPMDADFKMTWCSPTDSVFKAFSDQSSDALSPTESSRASVLALDIPFDAHVLPGRGVRTSCYLPALCVANETNISALMTSVAYQRHVYGISLPVVGICLRGTPTSIFAQVMIGWIDGMVECCRIPSVRIAMSKSNLTNSPSSGVYDLLDPCAAILLAQFVLSLSSHVDALSSTQFAPGDQTISWRADQTILYSPLLNPCCTDFMTEWHDQIQSYSDVDTTTNSTLYSVDIPKSDVLAKTRSTARSHMDDDQPSAFPDSSMTNIKRDETLKAPSNTLSSTSFKPTSCICEDLHTRGILVLAPVRHRIRIKRPVNDGDLNARLRVRDDVYETLALYLSITSPPQWPSNWIDGTNIFGGDPAYGYLQSRLLQDIKESLKTEPKRLQFWEETLPHHDFQTDDIVGFSLFLNHLSPFFLSVATARSSLFEKTVPSLGGNNRCNWDWVLQIACSEFGNTPGCCNWSEHTIAPPTACNKEAPDWCDFFALQSQIAIDQATFYPFGQIPGSRGILQYFGDALFHIDVFESDGESGSASYQNQDIDDTPIIASLLVAGDVDGDGHVRHVTSEGPSFCSKRPPDDFLSTLAVLRRQTSQTKEQVLDQCCLCMVSLLSSLKSAGLSTPVFGVVTDRTECTLLSAMQSQERGYNLAVREAPVRYDLTKPMDALLLFMTLHRIFRRQSEVFATLKEQ